MGFLNLTTIKNLHERMHTPKQDKKRQEVNEKINSVYEQKMRKARMEQERENRIEANEQKLMEQFKEKIKQDSIQTEEDNK